MVKALPDAKLPHANKPDSRICDPYLTGMVSTISILFQFDHIIVAAICTQTKQLKQLKPLFGTALLTNSIKSELVD